MKKFKIRFWDVVLIAVLALLLFTPFLSHLKRLALPNNKIEMVNKSPLNKESLTLELKGYNTPDLKLSDTKGKVVFLHFWGTWCPDCVLEMPSVQAFYDQYKNQIQFVLIDIEIDNNYTKLTKFIDKKKYTVPMYEAVSLFSTQLQVTSFPTTFIIDKEGNIVSKHDGATNWNLPEVQKPIVDLTKL